MPSLLGAISIGCLAFWAQYLIKSTEPNAECWYLPVAWVLFSAFFVLGIAN